MLLKIKNKVFKRIKFQKVFVPLCKEWQLQLAWYLVKYSKNVSLLTFIPNLLLFPFFQLLSTKNAENDFNDQHLGVQLPNAIRNIQKLCVFFSNLSNIYAIISVLITQCLAVGEHKNSKLKKDTFEEWWKNRFKDKLSETTDND